MTATLNTLRLLPLHERIQPVEELWDSVVADQAEVPLSDEQIIELDLRRAEVMADPSSRISWDEAKKSLWAMKA